MKPNRKRLIKILNKMYLDNEERADQMERDIKFLHECKLLHNPTVMDYIDSYGTQSVKTMRRTSKVIDNYIIALSKY